MRSIRSQDTSDFERVDQRPGLRVDGLYAGAKRADRRKAGDQRASVAEGRNAEPQRLNPPVSGSNATHIAHRNPAASHG
jgi:hypothetical protein